MTQNRPVETLLAELRERLPLHAKLGIELAQRHGMRYPCDFVALGTLKRSMCLIEGFCTLIVDNFVCASPLVRLQLDNVLRMGAVMLVADLNDFGLRVMKGEKVKDIVDKDGRKMNDGYLVNQLEKIEPGVKKAYEFLSGYVHFSNVHIANAIALWGERKGQFFLSGKDEFVTDENRRDHIVTMRSTTDLVLETVDDYLGLPVPPLPT